MERDQEGATERAKGSKGQEREKNEEAEESGQRDEALHRKQTKEEEEKSKSGTENLKKGCYWLNIINILFPDTTSKHKAFNPLLGLYR